MDNEKLIFDLLERIYTELQETKSEVQGIKSEVQGIKSEVQGIKSEVNETKKTVINIENDHGKKLKALFDGHTQISNQLERIMAEVSKHEDILIKKVK